MKAQTAGVAHQYAVAPGTCDRRCNVCCRFCHQACIPDKHGRYSYMVISPGRGSLNHTPRPASRQPLLGCYSPRLCRAFVEPLLQCLDIYCMKIDAKCTHCCLLKLAPETHQGTSCHQGRETSTARGSIHVQTCPYPKEHRGSLS